MKTVFLTGGRGDIGAAIKAQFEAAGYTVLAPSSAELNLEDLEGVTKYFTQNTIEADIFVHCAGFNTPKEVSDVTAGDMLKTAKINYISFVEIVKALAPYMSAKKYGRILAISSLYGTISRSGRLPYSTSKHALNGAVRTLSCELAPHNILVNALSPGFVDTVMTRKNNTPERIAQLTKKIPLGRMASVEDIANTAFYLCSDNNSYISGQNIIVDGGFMAEGGQN
ncbi:3-oxoacyl-[acyl-carrier protein] reductase [Elusimicrobium simillimum]|uniref:SDR family NAD(P)-dependent oxidoreductase n=1 Tax=Elusimicrobium simillimum TaxID=3143438 RepID=UPI003C6FAEBA